MSAETMEAPPVATDGLPMIGPDGKLHSIATSKPGRRNIEAWVAAWEKAIRTVSGPKALRALRAANGPLLASVHEQHPEEVSEVEAAIDDALARPAEEWEAE